MSSSNPVRKISFEVNLPRLLDEANQLISSVGFDKSAQQIGLTHTPSCAAENRYFESVGSLYDYEKDKFAFHERDFNVFNQDHQGSYFEWLYLNLPFKVARMRLMRMPPKKCLSIHEDTGPRYHIALKTNPFSYLFFPESKISFQIPADGFLYEMDATQLHTAFNADLSEDRIHLVFSDLEKS